jgi:hypothetical protein
MQDSGCNLFKLFSDVKRMPASIDATSNPFDTAILGEIKQKIASSPQKK